MYSVHPQTSRILHAVPQNMLHRTALWQSVLVQPLACAGTLATSDMHVNVTPVEAFACSTTLAQSPSQTRAAPTAEENQQPEHGRNHRRRQKQKLKRKLNNRGAEDATSQQNEAALAAPTTAAAAASAVRPAAPVVPSTTAGAQVCEPPDEKDVPSRLRALAIEDVQVAWRKLQTEFLVQHLIWQSQRLCSPSNEWASASKELQSALDRALKTRSILAVQSVLRRNVLDSVLNNATSDACKQLLEADNLAEHRWQLAQQVNNAQGSCSMTNLTDMDILMASCKIGEAGLQHAVKQALGMPLQSTVAKISSSGKAIQHGPRKEESQCQSNETFGSRPSSTQGSDISSTCSSLARSSHHKITVKNTFIEIETESDGESCASTASRSSRRSQSVPRQHPCQ